jgi:hypothetical protein
MVVGVARFSLPSLDSKKRLRNIYCLGWCSFGKSFNLTALIEGHTNYGLPGLYRIDCVGVSAALSWRRY